MLQLLSCIFRLSISTNPPVGSRHQKRQGLLLQHVWTSLYLRDVPNETHVEAHSGGASGQSTVTTESRISQRSSPHFPHLSAHSSPIPAKASKNRLFGGLTLFLVCLLVCFTF